MNNVKIVHAIGTGGPLYESLGATFERIEHLFNITNIKYTADNLKKLKNKEIDLRGIEVKVANVLSSNFANYNDTWTKIENMLQRVLPNTIYLKRIFDIFNCYIF